MTFASGAAALAHQLLWTRRLVDIVGASADSFSRVIGAFFVGLALGAWLASRHELRPSRFWKGVCCAELAVAVLATLPLLGRSLYESIHSLISSAGWLKWILPVVLITPAATAMGCVMPWMLRALGDEPWFKSRHAIVLYAVNTAGGITGLALVVAFGLPQLGLNSTAFLVIALNVALAIAAFCLNRYAYCQAPPPANSTGPAAPAIGIRWLAIASAASGFLVLASEVVLQHQLSQIAINSLFSSALVLAIVLASITAAAFVAPVLRRSSHWTISPALVGTAVLCAAQPLLLNAVHPDLELLPYELPVGAYTWQLLKLGAVASAPMLLLGGLIFPLLLGAALDSGEDGPRRAGILLACNGFGGWLGTELGQSWLAPTFGLWLALVAIGAGYAILYASLPSIVQRPAFKGLVVLGLALVLAAIAWASRTLPMANVGPNERLVAAKIGREGLVATVDCGPGDWRMLFNNSYALGGSTAQFNQERQGMLPLLLHGNPRRVATLGVATGSTVAGASLYSGVEGIEAIELSALVLEYAREYFQPYTRNVFNDRRVTFVHDDARWVMATARNRYDVVIGDLFLPWRTGEARLYTREHFANVRGALRDGGVFCQWLPMFQLTRSHYEVIARTFAEVFPDAFLVRGDFYTDLPILGLVGGRSFNNIDWQAVRAKCLTIQTAAIKDPLLRRPEGVAMTLIGPLPPCAPGPLNTLANSWVEWNAGKNIIGMREPWFIAVPLAEYIRDAHRAGVNLLPTDLRDAHDSRQFFLTLEIAAKLQLPSLPDLKSQISQRIPASMRDDTAVDWQQWPMRIKPDFRPAP